MSNVRWDFAKDVFDLAVELPPNERSAYLREACKSDDVHIAEIEALLDAYDRAGSFLGTDWLIEATDLSLNAGDVVSGRFQIVRAVGEGGMGRVYEAIDSELGVTVALKALRPEIASDPQVLARFRREVRIAHSITHRNVCRTFQLDREVRRAGPNGGRLFDLTFISMEYLDGETLQQVIKRNGKLALDYALEIARQMADAIEAAHSIDVVHRDIKPSNIMICPAPDKEMQADRIVMTDFGLAKSDGTNRNSEITAVSHPGRPMGTLSYMSPEQLQGGEAGKPTDIYAFGLVLFEMVTGEKAFSDCATLELALRRVNAIPPSPRQLLPGIPSAWEEAIQRCLQVNPAARPKRARYVVSALEGTPYTAMDAEELRGLKPSRLQSGSPKKTTIRPAMIAGLMCLVALFCFALRFYKLKPDSSVSSGTPVYLAPVSNQTGEKNLSHITELIQAGLEQSNQIQLLESYKVDDTLRDMRLPPDVGITPPIAREIAMRTGAARVVFPAITGSKGLYHLEVEIQRPDASTPQRFRDRQKKSWDWRDNSVSSETVSEETSRAVEGASDWIRHVVGESANDIARLDVPPEDVTTSNWQALSDFTYAEKLNSQTKREEAVTALRAAVAKDPSFALAYGLMGDTLINSGHSAEGFRSYRLALDADLRGRLSLRERDRIKGMLAEDSLDLQAAEAAYKEYTLYYEHDYFGWFRRANSLLRIGRPRDAALSLEHAHRLDPAKPGAVVQLIGANMILGDDPSVDRWVSEVKRLYSREYYLYAYGPVQVVRGDYSGAGDTFEELRKSPLPAFAWAGSAMLAALRTEQGRPAEALGILSARLDLDPGNPSILLDRADIYCSQHQFKSCLNDLREANSVDPGVAIRLTSSGLLGRAISLSSGQARQEFLEFLGSLAKQKQDANNGLIAELESLRIRGEVLLANGHVPEAISQFRKASALDPSNESREYLARALEAAGRRKLPAVSGKAELTEAASIYAATALHPASVWRFSQAYPPGFYTGQIEAFLRLPPTITEPIAPRTNMFRALAVLRPQSGKIIRSEAGHPPTTAVKFPPP